MRSLTARGAVAVAYVLLLGFGVAGASSSGPTALLLPPAATPGAPVLFYVVGPERDGQPEYLFDIAARTLGNGNRFGEILDLNRGRRQSDGATLTDATKLHQGWVLVLPPGARGTGVAAASGEKDRDGGFVMGTALVVTVLALWCAAAVRPLRSARRATSLVPRPLVVPRLAIAAGSLSSLTTAAEPSIEHEFRTPGPGETGPPAPGGPDIDLDLEIGAQRWHVRLLGAVDDHLGPGARWLTGSQESAPSMSMPVGLGWADERWLWVDLARCPGMLTVSGPVDQCRGLARTLAQQLQTAGVAVTAVAGALGDDPPDGCHQIAAISRRSPVAPGVIVIAGLDVTTMLAARQLASRDDRVVPIVIGPVARSRWSLRLRDVSVRTRHMDEASRRWGSPTTPGRGE